MNPDVYRYKQLRLNYWSITKCASTTMRLHFKNINLHPNKRAPDNKIIRKFNNSGHLGLQTAVDQIKVEKAIGNGYRNIAFTRHPYERFLSAYNDLFVKRRERGEKAFKKFKDLKTPIQVANECFNLTDKELDIHFKPMHTFLRDEVEVFDLKRVLQNWHFNFEKPNYQLHTTQNNKNVLLVPELKDLIYRRYREDFKLYGYSR